MAISWASFTGCHQGATITADPTSTRSVRPAQYDSHCRGLACIE